METAVWIIGIVIAIFIWGYLSDLIKAPKENEELKKKLDNAALEIKKAKVDAEALALQIFNGYKEHETENIKKQMFSVAKLEYTALFEKWKLDHTEAIKSDAINRSLSAIAGKVSEHFVPFISADFAFNPKEARFIGSPIDMIVFEGIDSESDYVNVHIIEIKTGNSNLTKRQLAIKRAIEEKRVYWKEIKMPSIVKN